MQMFHSTTRDYFGPMKLSKNEEIIMVNFRRKQFEDLELIYHKLLLT